MAVFYRINAMSRVMEDALRRAHVPYQIARGTEFYNRKEIKDALAYLRVLVNPADEVSLLRIINVPARGIGKVTVDRLREAARHIGRPTLEVVLSPQAGGIVGKAAAGKLARFAQLIADLTALAADRPVREVLETTLVESGMQAALDQGSDSDPLENVNELITAAAEFDARGEEGGLVAWLHQISLVSDQDAFDAQRGAVTLMTLHAAKGLEFPVVFMIGLEDGTLPHARYRENPGEIEEERRLCFVGMTRAKLQLTMSYAAFRMARGVAMRSNPSQFIREIGRDSVVIEQPKATETQSEPPPPADVDFHDGQLVRHPKFGVGQVLWIDPRGRQTRAAVRFAGGERTLILEYANLQVVDESE
jgi:DNA helicase-2/ATP-dependent DNA helicase PcrA